MQKREGMKNKKHFTPYVCIALLLLVLLALLIARLTSPASPEENDGNEPSAIVSPTDATPTPPPGPGYVPGTIVIGGKLISLDSGGSMVPPQYLEKMEQAEYLGETKEPVPDNEYPAEELQSNYIPAGYKVYHLVTDEEDSYIVYGEEDFYCIYATEWHVIEPED